MCTSSVIHLACFRTLSLSLPVRMPHACIPPPRLIAELAQLKRCSSAQTTMDEYDLDIVLVPLGLLSMASYHMWLLYRIARRPTTTVVGINAINRRLWVQAMMEDPSKNGILAVQTLRNNIMASTLLASMAIMLSSLIAVLMTSCGRTGPRGHDLVVGDRSDRALSVKFVAILICFLLAFLLNVQSIRFYSHASLLVNAPVKNHRCSPARAAEYVAEALNRGSYFWSLGLRAFYFSFPLILWVFGPIPMVCCCLVMVVMLYFLDVYYGWEEREEAQGGC